MNKFQAIGATLAMGAALTGVACHSGPKPLTKGCVVTQTEVKPVGPGMPGTFQLTYCGVGVEDMILICPRNSTKVPGQNAVMLCTDVLKFPHGFPKLDVSGIPLPEGYK
jgi:hypothetical protein